MKQELYISEINNLEKAIITEFKYIYTQTHIQIFNR